MYSVSTPSPFSTLSLSASSTVNSFASTVLTVAFSLSMEQIGYVNNSLLQLTFPSEMSVLSTTCALLSPNLISVSCSEDATRVKAKLTYSDLTAGE